MVQPLGGNRQSDPDLPDRGVAVVEPMKMPATLPSTSAAAASGGTAFGCARDFLGQRFVYTVISPRAGGLSVGVNMNPDRRCNFDCIYCEVNRQQPVLEKNLDVPAMIAELERTLDWVHSGQLRGRPCHQLATPEMLRLRHVALSGDGEPTLSANFLPAVEALMHLRARGRFPFFKLVLITNASGLDRPEVVAGLKHFTSRDEVWAKLESGTQDYTNQIQRPDRPLEQIVASILGLARQRPVIIQSLFPAIGGQGPAATEIEAYLQRLVDLKAGGAQIPLVQIYSATRPTQSNCGHLPLRILSQIARRVREVTGLRAEVY